MKIKKIFSAAIALFLWKMHVQSFQIHFSIVIFIWLITQPSTICVDTAKNLDNFLLIAI